MTAGTATTCTYDVLGRLTQVLHLGKDGSTLLSLEYLYDANGQIAEILRNGVSMVYSYDANGQLIAVNSGESYSYDPVGNRISSTDASGTFSYTTDNMNRYTSKGGMTFEYDLMGNLAKAVESAQETVYEYDIAGRLVRVTKPDGWQWSCQYDAMGDRVQVNSNGTISWFVHDPTGMINLSEEYDAGGSLVRRYIHTGTLALDETPSGERRYYHADMQGSTRLLTDNNGDVISLMDYTAFGDIAAQEGVSTPFAYVGGLGVIRDDTGLLYMRNRYYSPSEGRFIQTDPIGLNAGDINFYRYCGNDPILGIDPMGTTDINVNNGFSNNYKRYQKNNNNNNNGDVGSTDYCTKLKNKRREVEKMRDEAKTQKQKENYQKWIDQINETMKKSKCPDDYSGSYSNVPSPEGVGENFDSNKWLGVGTGLMVAGYMVGEIGTSSSAAFALASGGTMILPASVVGVGSAVIGGAMMLTGGAMVMVAGF